MRLREHYMQQLDALNAELRSLSQLVIAAIAWSLDAFERQDAVVAQRVIANDDDIDHAQDKLGDHAVGVIATQQPVAGDLRRLLATMEAASELERIADYAKSIAKVVIRNLDQQPLTPPSGITEMSQQALSMLHQALEAFIHQDVDAARRLALADDQVDTLQKQVRATLLERLQDEPSNASQLADLLLVVHNLERIADRTTNIGELVVYMVTGSQVELNS